MNRTVNLLIGLLMLAGCSGGEKRVVTVFHAGSLSLPFKQMERAFEEANPGIDIQLEAAGSVACARKITDLGRECDIMASADYNVIDELLIPGHTGINIRFASNSMVIAYRPESAFADSINSSNWPEILLREDVIYGRSDPDSDPCGYRSLMTMQLSEEYYGLPSLTASLSAKDRNMIRPKEVDLVALLETGVIDYFFIYKSVAMQHNLHYIELPREVDLSDSLLKDHYATVSVDIRGSAPGETITMRGGEMVYGITLLDRAPARSEALKFLAWIIGPEGQEIMVENGQSVFSPAPVNRYDLVPAELKELTRQNPGHE